jgi:hypothetical protein
VKFGLVALLIFIVSGCSDGGSESPPSELFNAPLSVNPLSLNTKKYAVSAPLIDNSR